MDGESGSVMGSTGNINLSHDEATEDLTGHIHQLPCCIKHNGPCSVSHFFKPKQFGSEIEGLRVEETCFKGRKLSGATVPLPECYIGFVLGKKSRGKRKVCDDREMNAKFNILKS